MKKIITKRLELISGSIELAKAELSDRALFSRLLGAKIPENWPPEYNNDDTITFFLQKLLESPDQQAWWCWYFILQGETPILIGNGGFKGKPTSEGTVEIGYSILKKYQNQGYATEAVQSLIAWAFEHNEVQKVIAETLPELTPSIRVLEKCGFINIGEGSEPEIIRYQLSRNN